jgi:hypothetical protein
VRPSGSHVGEGAVHRLPDKHRSKSPCPTNNPFKQTGRRRCTHSDFAFGAAECRSGGHGRLESRIAERHRRVPAAPLKMDLAYRYDGVSRNGGYDGRSPRRPGARARSRRGSSHDASRNRGGVAIAHSLCRCDARHSPGLQRAFGARRKSAMLPLPRTADRRHLLKPCRQTRWKAYRRSRLRIPGSQRAPTAAVICCWVCSGRSIGYAVNSQSRCKTPSTSIFSCSPPWLVRSPWCFPRIVDACLLSDCSGRKPQAGLTQPTIPACADPD